VNDRVCRVLYCCEDSHRHSSFNTSGLDWEAVRIAAEAVGVEGVPACFDESLLLDEDFLKAMHDLLIDIDVVKGVLTCPESGRRFIIDESIPKIMLVDSQSIHALMIHVR